MNTFLLVSLAFVVGMLLMCFIVAGKSIICNGLMFFFAIAQYLAWKWDQFTGKR